MPLCATSRSEDALAVDLPSDFPVDLDFANAAVCPEVPSQRGVFFSRSLRTIVSSIRSIQTGNQRLWLVKRNRTRNGVPANASVGKRRSIDSDSVERLHQRHWTINAETINAAKINSKFRPRIAPPNIAKVAMKAKCKPSRVRRLRNKFGRRAKRKGSGTGDNPIRAGASSARLS